MNIRTNILSIPFDALLNALLTLSKARLSLLVVFSSVLPAFIVGGHSAFTIFLPLAVGGFLISASASAANQFLERELDAKMSRTLNRPLVTGQLSTFSVLLFIGITAILGATILWYINSSVVIISLISWFSYVFLYTPLKQSSNFAVFVGAIPGALPVLAGTTAIEESISLFGFMLFTLQFLWQFPHFWAIAWLSNDDYKNAGFRLLPGVENEKDESVGWYSFSYCVFLLPLSVLLWYNGFIVAWSMGGLLLLGGAYTYLCWQFYKKKNDKIAKKVMFFSFIYLPLALIVCLIGSI